MRQENRKKQVLLGVGTINRRPVYMTGSAFKAAVSTSAALPTVWFRDLTQPPLTAHLLILQIPPMGSAPRSPPFPLDHLLFLSAVYSGFQWDIPL